MMGRGLLLLGMVSCALLACGVCAWSQPQSIDVEVTPSSWAPGTVLTFTVTCGWSSYWGCGGNRWSFSAVECTPAGSYTTYVPGSLTYSLSPLSGSGTASDAGTYASGTYPFPSGGTASISWRRRVKDVVPASVTELKFCGEILWEDVGYVGCMWISLPGEVTLPRGKADYVISALDRTDAGTKQPGDSIQVSFTTKNQGGSPATASSNTSIYLSSDTTITTFDKWIYDDPVPALAAGATDAHTSVSIVIPADTAAGTYYIGAIADRRGNIAESDETNNTRYDGTVVVGTPPPVFPDYVVSSLSRCDSGSRLPAQTIQVSFTTANVGTGPAALSSTTSIYLSTDTVIDAADAVIYGASVPPLGAGGSDVRSCLTMTIPAGTLPGTYYILATADRTGNIAESNETNNSAADGTVVVIAPPPPPDYAISSLNRTDSGSRSPEQSIQVSFTTKNQGIGAAIAVSTTSIYLSSDTIIEALHDIKLYDDPVPALVAGATDAHTSVAMVIPKGTAAGTYYIGAIADRAGNIAENYETNNTRYDGTVVVGTPPQPDYIIGSLSRGDSGSRAPGQRIQVSFTTKNQGSGAATVTSTTSIYLSSDTNITTSDIKLYDDSVPALAAGTTDAHTSVPVAIPADTAAGTYYIGAIADRAGNITESNEGNNTAYDATVTVLPVTDLPIGTTLPGSLASASDVRYYRVTPSATVGQHLIGIAEKADLWFGHLELFFGGLGGPPVQSAYELTDSFVEANPAQTGYYYLAVRGDHSETYPRSYTISAITAEMLPTVQLGGGPTSGMIEGTQDRRFYRITPSLTSGQHLIASLASADPIRYHFCLHRGGVTRPWTDDASGLASLIVEDPATDAGYYYLQVGPSIYITVIAGPKAPYPSSFTLTAQVAGGGRVLSVPDVTAAPSGITQVPMNISDASGVAGIDFTLGFDPAVVQCTDVTTTALTTGWAIVPNIDNSTGQVIVSMASATAISSGTGAVAQVHFDAAGTPGDCSGLTISGPALYDQSASPIPVTTVDGGICLGNSCDVNHDGVVNSEDVTKVLRAAVGLDSCSTCDVNCDGRVSSGDAIIVLRVAVGLQTCPTCH